MPKMVIVLGAGASPLKVFGTVFKDGISKREPDFRGRGNLLADYLGFRKGFERFTGTVDQFLSRRSEFREVGQEAISAFLLEKECRDADPGWVGQLDPILVNKDIELEIITFNYDRGLEFFLSEWWQLSYKLDGKDAAKAVEERVKIRHVYGRLGKLPHFSGDGPVVEYHCDNQALAIEAAKGIRLIGEREEQGFTEECIQSINQCQVLLFLGFGFHEENLKLLGLGRAEKKLIFASAHGQGVGVRSLLRQQFSHEFCFGGVNENVEEFLGRSAIIRAFASGIHLNSYAQDMKGHFL